VISNANLRSHCISGLAPGPKLIVTGAVHGNEVAGTKGIRRVLAEIDSGDIEIVRGSVTFVPVCNPLAYNNMRRMGDRNLNRRLQPTATPQDFEDRLANALCPLLAAHEVLLDLHSFRSPGQPFVMRGPADNRDALEPFTHAAAEARLAAHVGVNRIVEGWMQAYSDGITQRKARLKARAESLASDSALARREGDSSDALASALAGVHEDPSYGVGTTEYMRSQGGYGVTLECGQHDDPEGPEVAYVAIRQTLALLGLADIPLVPPAKPFESLVLAEVIDRHSEGDRFVQAWTSFDPLAEGQMIAVRADGSELRAPRAGYIVFPDAAALPGHEWFYLAQASRRPVLAQPLNPA
jgi:succinylglutamate desuccinylase